jgi:hypothetical protein
MAATDPVSVLATLKEIGARGRLALIIETESLLNDGTTAILFAIAIGLVTGGPVTYKAVAITLGATVAIAFTRPCLRTPAGQSFAAASSAGRLPLAPKSTGIRSLHANRATPI